MMRVIAVALVFLTACGSGRSEVSEGFGRATPECLDVHEFEDVILASASVPGVGVVPEVYHVEGPSSTLPQAPLLMDAIVHDSEVTGYSLVGPRISIILEDPGHVFDLHTLKVCYDPDGPTGPAFSNVLERSRVAAVFSLLNVWLIALDHEPQPGSTYRVVGRTLSGARAFTPRVEVSGTHGPVSHLHGSGTKGSRHAFEWSHWSRTPDRQFLVVAFNVPGPGNPLSLLIEIDPTDTEWREGWSRLRDLHANGRLGWTGGGNFLWTVWGVEGGYVSGTTVPAFGKFSN